MGTSEPTVVIRRRDLFAILFNVWLVGLLSCDGSVGPLWFAIPTFVYGGLWLITRTRKGAIRDAEGRF